MVEIRSKNGHFWIKISTLTRRLGVCRVDHEVMRIMKELEKKVINHFKLLLSQRVALHRLIMFGSRARGDAEPDSDSSSGIRLSDHRTGYIGRGRTTQLLLTQPLNEICA